MKCEMCGGKKIIQVVYAAPHEVFYIPCPTCQGMEESCCEGSERHGQIGPGDENETIKEPLPRSCCKRAREFVAAGGDAGAIFEFYRGDVLSLRGPAWAFAKLTIEENQKTGPRFAKYSPMPEGRFPVGGGEVLADLGEGTV